MGTVRQVTREGRLVANRLVQNRPPCAYAAGYRFHTWFARRRRCPGRHGLGNCRSCGNDAGLLRAKVLLYQHFEEWSGDRDRVLATWRLPLKKIVIADWLRQIAIGEGESADYIPNGVDQTAFAIDVPLLDRDPHTVMMLYHTFDWKGSNDGLAALRAVKREVPDMKVILFGVPNEPPNLEDWIEYHQLPSQPALRALYNRAAIFIAPSWAEGWPLPPAEAMLCGAATVLTDIGGHREFGKDGQTTLFAKANDPDSFVQPLFALLNDSALRIQISQRALTYIQNFTWLRATIAMEQALMEPPNGRS